MGKENQGKFCGCCQTDVRLLCLVFGGITLFLTVVCFIGNITQLALDKEIDDLNSMISLIIQIVLGILTITCAILLLVGAAKLKRVLLLSWIFGAAILLFLYIFLFILSSVALADTVSQTNKSGKYNVSPEKFEMRMSIAIFNLVLIPLLFISILLATLAAKLLRDQIKKPN